MTMNAKRLTLYLLVVMSAAVAYGQEFTGRISDLTGAAIPKATITVHNVLTNDNVTTRSSGSGDYTVPYLKVGRYTVSANAPGFETLVKDDIVLEVGKTAVINFNLKVGASSDTVTVQATAVLDAGKADRGEVTENARVTELPINGRDPEMLALLSAGVVWGNSQNYSQYQRPFDSTATSLMINGGGAGNNELLLDGITNDSGNGNSVVGYVPPVDSVQEFKIITNAYDAQYGRAQGGVEDIVLKGGTNSIHGDVYEFARRTYLDADTYRNDFVNSQDPGTSPKGQHKLDQYGFELDGPVVVPHLYNGRDKTFFVTQFENYNEVVPNTIITSVPDPAWITGDFSKLTYWTGTAYAPITIYDPASLHRDASDNLVRDPFPGNIIPQSRINSVAQKLLAYYPAPNLTPAAGTNPFANNYATLNPTTDTYRNALAKLDRTFSQNDKLTLRYAFYERFEVRNDNGLPGEAGSGSLPFGQRGNNFNIEYTHTFTPSLLLDVRGSVIVRYNGYNNGPQNFNTGSLGWSNPEYLGNHLPRISVNEFAPLGNGGANVDVENTAALFPSATWVKGRHTVHIGADIRDLQHAIKSSEAGASFYVDRQWTQSNYIGSQYNSFSGNSVASMLLGDETSGGNNINPESYYVQHYFAPFIQDDWKFSRKLTLNLGFRYDLNGPPVERHNRTDYAFNTSITNPVDALVNHALLPGPVKGGVTFVGVGGNPNSIYSLAKGNVQPRVGFAYAATDKIVVRGGFGRMFKNPTAGGNQYGYSSYTPFNASYDGGATVATTLTDPFPFVVQPVGSSLGALTALGQGPYFINPNYKTPGIYQYSFGLQQQLLRADTIEISYVGSHGFNQDSSDNINHYSAAYAAHCNPDLGGQARLCNDPVLGQSINPFQGIAAFEGSGYYSPSTIQSGNLTRPYTAYGDLIEYQLNAGSTSYNSLQVIGVHRFNSHGPVVHGTWTWSKLQDSGGYADETYRIVAHSLDGNDITHRVTLSGVYTLPIGRGQHFFPKMNRALDVAVGGWEISPLYVYQTGTPWGVPGGLEYLGNARVPRTIDPTTGYLRGVNACVGTTDDNTDAHQFFIPAAASQCSTFSFLQRPSYGVNANVVYTGIRIPSLQQFDANLSKNIPLYERLKLQLRLEGFNVLNHPLFQEGYNGNPYDPNFGTIAKGPNGQSNLPRQVQLAVKLMW